MDDKPQSPGLDWIQLVRLTAPGLLALLVKVASTAHAVERGDPIEPEEKAGPKAKAKAKKPPKPEALPEAIAERLEVVEATSASLSSALAHQDPKGKLALPGRTEADKNIDGAIKSLDSFLISKIALPKTSARAGKVHEAFFRGEGLDFINADFEAEWADVKSRIELLDAKGFAKDIEDIGGADVLEHLRDMFKAYGIALGITEVKTQAAKVDVKKPYLAAMDALRRYVAVVVGYGAGSDKKREKGELAAALLAPVEAAREKNALKAGRSTKEEGEAPVTEEPTDGKDNAPADDEEGGEGEGGGTD